MSLCGVTVQKNLTFISKAVRPKGHATNVKQKDADNRRRFSKNVKILVEDVGEDVRIILKIMLAKRTIRMRSRSVWSTCSPKGCSGEHVDQILINLVVVTVMPCINTLLYCKLSRCTRYS